MNPEQWSCPNCNAIWGFDEWQFEQCDCCGYPDQIEDEEVDEDYFDESDFDGWMTDYDFNEC